MTSLANGPCPWTLSPSCSSALPDRAELEDGEAEALYDFLLAASTEILWRASGRRYGLCTYTVRPCRPGCEPSPTYQYAGARPGFSPALVNGSWKNCGSCGDCGSCRCCTAGCAEVALPGPVHSVTQVIIDGEELYPSNFVVQNSTLLVRTDGLCWPTCQDFSVADGEVGSWSVRFTHGLPVTPLGQMALDALFTEMWKGCSGAECALPLNTDGIFRQGVNLDFADKNLDLLSSARTGIPAVDRFLASVNPYGIHEPASVYSVDVPRSRITTWAP